MTVMPVSVSCETFMITSILRRNNVDSLKVHEAIVLHRFQLASMTFEFIQTIDKCRGHSVFATMASFIAN
ncbi:hypothetical protein T03_17363 [Trichinella britovi]|uniref:Uncharacterized protein n=1 Tax=Trichinella britovi TaxID=45882 RepID=A0A0V1C578_TRIBR|nr:hypothetical protein T03_17363 [Trichinella britovi]